jgi:hypothetical protein
MVNELLMKGRIFPSQDVFASVEWMYDHGARIFQLCEMFRSLAKIRRGKPGFSSGMFFLRSMYSLSEYRISHYRKDMQFIDNAEELANTSNFRKRLLLLMAGDVINSKCRWERFLRPRNAAATGTQGAAMLALEG